MFENETEMLAAHDLPYLERIVAEVNKGVDHKATVVDGKLYVDLVDCSHELSGSFNYDKIALALIGYTASKRRELKERSVYDTNEVLAKSLKEELGLKDYSGAIRGSKHTEGRVVFSVNIAASMTPDRARELFNALKEFGLQPSY